MIGLGKPKTLPCQESRFVVHWTRMLKSHDALEPGLASAWNFSSVSGNAAHQPITPATIEPDGEAQWDECASAGALLACVGLWQACLCGCRSCHGYRGTRRCGVRPRGEATFVR